MNPNFPQNLDMNFVNDLPRVSNVLNQPSSDLSELLPNIAMEEYPWLRMIRRKERPVHIRDLVGRGIIATAPIPKGSLICNFRGFIPDKMEDLIVYAVFILLNY